jgi:hypothetical protein
LVSSSNDTRFMSVNATGVIRFRNITIGTASPTGGYDGDIYLQYTP